MDTKYRSARESHLLSISGLAGGEGLDRIRKDRLFGQRVFHELRLIRRAYERNCAAPRAVTRTITYDP